MEILNLKQGTQEWLDFRKTKITATDASVIMRVNPWKTPLQLFKEKKGLSPSSFVNDAMKRGIELEPVARELFMIETGFDVQPTVVCKDWAMASLDGYDIDLQKIVEIKCPGKDVHEMAARGQVPDYYFPQLQFQMFVCDVYEAYYYSYFEGEGISICVLRDDIFIEKMIKKCREFYEKLLKDEAPEMLDRDFQQRNDYEWVAVAESLEKRQESLRKQLLTLANDKNVMGGGVCITQVQKKGTIDYSIIPVLKSVDLEQYRKAPTTYSRITTS